MGVIGSHDPVMLIIAVFSAFPETLTAVRHILTDEYGDILCESPRFSFMETDYYESSMGGPLEKQFFAFKQLITPDRLPSIKLQTNDLEKRCQREQETGVERVVNLDPGYLCLGKWVLASTKDHAHRLYLGDGIYGEITLKYQTGQFQTLPWTYPDYCRSDFQFFFMQARDHYRRCLREED